MKDKTIALLEVSPFGVLGKSWFERDPRTCLAAAQPGYGTLPASLHFQASRCFAQACAATSRYAVTGPEAWHQSLP